MKRLIIPLLFLIQIVLLQAQQDLPCDPNPSCTWTTVSGGASIFPISEECNVTVNFEIRECNGVTEFKITSTSTSGTCSAYTLQQ